MREWFAVGLGGFLGALARYAVSGAVQRRVESPWPLGTLSVNAIGCLVLGLALGWVRARPDPGPGTLFLTVGLLGSFTTFSTLGLELWDFVRAGDWPRAVGYALASVLVGLGALALGHALGQRVGWGAIEGT